MKDLLKDILDNPNIWHAYQKRMINKAGASLNRLRITSRSAVKKGKELKNGR